jgi:hypothetical protein
MGLERERFFIRFQRQACIAKLESIFLRCSQPPQAGTGADARNGPALEKRDTESPHDAGHFTPSLIVEGWRFYPHSYAIVN